MPPVITYVPVSGGSTITVTFDTIDTDLTRFRGLRESLGSRAVSVGGQAVAVAYDSFFRYQVAFKPFTSPSATAAVGTELGDLHGWIAHAQRGGEFTFAVDSSKTWATTLSGAEAQNQTTLSVSSVSGISGGDYCIVEDVDDPTMWEKRRITSVGASDVTVNGGVVFSYASGSVIRYHEYFPACILEPMNSNPLVERDAGRGANLWDLQFTFRTVR